MKKSDGRGKRANYPKVKTLSGMADQYRPKERQVFDGEPVEIGPPPVERNWQSALSYQKYDVVDRFQHEGRMRTNELKARYKYARARTRGA